MTVALDDTDRAILRYLQRDARASAKAVGAVVGLSQPATWRRIARLEQAGVIRGRRAVLDAAKAGFGVSVFLGVKLASRGRVSLEDFERAVSAIPEVVTVAHVLTVLNVVLSILNFCLTLAYIFHSLNNISVS